MYGTTWSQTLMSIWSTMTTLVSMSPSNSTEHLDASGGMGPHLPLSIRLGKPIQNCQLFWSIKGIDWNVEVVLVVLVLFVVLVLLY